MPDKNQILDQIQQLTKAYFENDALPPFVKGVTPIPLSIPSYGSDESFEAIESILSSWVTLGKKVQRFENDFSDYAGVSHAAMTTSGSTANHLALAVLSNPEIKDHLSPGDEVITPALTFATTVYPISDLGLIPVLVDVDHDTLNLNLNQVEAAITKKTKAIMPVHLLGNPCAIKGIMDIAQRYNLKVIEDVCDSSGAEVDGKKAGSFGDIATYSFFFTHIMTTIEGGMVVTSDPLYSELSKSLRSFGWARGLENETSIARDYPEIDSRFLFLHRGFNFKPTEIQAAFGIHQLKRLDGFIQARRNNAAYWSQHLNQYGDFFSVLHEQPNTKSAWYGYPIIVNSKAPFSRQQFREHLDKRGVDTRPILSGNIAQQPVYQHLKCRQFGPLNNARHIQNNAFFFGNHQGIEAPQREAILEYIDEFIAGYS